MERFREWLAAYWYPAFLVLLAGTALAFLLFFHLGKLLPGLSQPEAIYLETFNNLSAAIRNALNLPHKLLVVLFSQLNLSVPASRIASAIFGFMLGVGFWYLLRVWYSRRVALFGTLLFLTSAWFLHVARFGTDEIMQSLLILPLASALLLQTHKNNAAIALNAALLMMLLYVPGLIWFLIPLLVWQAKRVIRYVKNQNPIIIVLIFTLSIGLITPLALTMYINPSLFTYYLGIPEALPSLGEYLKNLLRIPLNLFLLGPDNPVLWLGRLPLLSWFSSVMFITGIYAYFFKRRLDRTWFIVYVFVGGSLLSALDGPVTLYILMPFVYLVVAAGVALMLQQWFTVFPRNPFARILGPTLLSVVVLLTAFYNLNHYFIAWPNTPETKSAHNEQLQTVEGGDGALLLQ